MTSPEASDPRRRGAGELPVEAVVPERAVLTELARGFLLVQGRDPKRAVQFAATFLREQAGPAQSGRIVPPDRMSSVRRGVASALRESRPPGGDRAL